MFQDRKTLAFYSAGIVVVNVAVLGLAAGFRGQFFLKTRRHELAHTREVGTYALHCIGANFSVGTNFERRRKNLFKKLASE
jgi:hypothetical protein